MDTDSISVGRLFATTFGVPPDRRMEDMPIDTPCGYACRRVIDAGAQLFGAIREAHGDEYEATKECGRVADIVAKVCITFITG